MFGLGRHKELGEPLARAGVLGLIKAALEAHVAFSLHVSGRDSFACPKATFIS